MGEVAKTLVSLSGPQSVHGIIPEALMAWERRGRPHGGADSANPEEKPAIVAPDESKWGRTTLVPDMHSRKKLMASEVIAGGPGSGFVALSGGFGTLEEIMEIATWNQLGIHSKGVVLYNVEGYWDGIVGWIKGAVEKGFAREGNKGIVVEAKDAEEVVRALQEYKVAEERFNLDWGQS